MRGSETLDSELAQLDLVTGIVDPDDYTDMSEDEIAALDVWTFDPEQFEHDDERGEG